MELLVSKFMAGSSSGGEGSVLLVDADGLVVAHCSYVR